MLTFRDDRTTHFHEPCLNQEQVDQLHEAIVILGSVADEMDSTAIECETCSATRRTNWNQHQIKLKLEGMLSKIESVLKWERNASGT